MSWIDRLKDSYLIVSNSLFIVILIAIGSILFENIYYSAQTPSYTSSSENVRDNYDHMSASDVDDLLHNTWVPGYEYEEVVGFSEKPRKSTYVNVNDAGFRSTSSPESFYAELEGAVWFFGGSTTFGYGVADDETVPVYLAEFMKKPVINLGRGYYFSEQENMLLAEFLRHGYRPSQVVFFDGLNERCGIDVYQREMKILFKDQQTQGLGSYFITVARPILRLLVKIVENITPAPAMEQRQVDNQNRNRTSCNVGGNLSIPLKQVLGNNLRMREAICGEYRINCMTFVQPIAGMHGVHLDRDLDPQLLADIESKYQHLESTFAERGALFATSALDGFPNHAYVDAVHHSADANRVIANHLFNIIRNNKKIEVF